MTTRIKCPTSIAILMATYNGDKYLREQIESIIHQTNKDWTLYIHDDGSRDSTKSIINYYCCEYKNIVYLEDDVLGRGAAQSFFYMLERVDSEYYMFSDQDDFWLCDKVSISYNSLSNSDLGGGYLQSCVLT